MREPFVQAATLDLDAGADPAALGGAVTVALCGHWEHDGACRWPHHSRVEDVAGSFELRTVFLAGPDEEADVRERIGAALAGGSLEGPDHRVSRWRVLGNRSADLTPADAELAAGMADGHADR